MRDFVLKIWQSLVVYLILAGTACSRIDTGEFEDGRVTVGFFLGDNPTKTILDPSASAFSWQTGDKVALWAEPVNTSAEGSAATGASLQAQPFTLISRDHSKAYFTSTLSSAMPQGEYMYRISYPQPQSFGGNTAGFDLPSVQDGCVSSGTGIAVSEQFRSRELRALNESAPAGETVSFNVRLHHLLHYLRFYVPRDNNILGEPVSRIEFTMPQPVAGRVDVNLSDGSASLAGETSSRIVIIPDSAVQCGEFLTAGIFPPETVYGEGDVMNVRVFSAHHFSDVEPIRLSGRNFPAGHITSVPLKVKTAKDLYTLRFTLDSNNLGEDVQSITLSFDRDIVVDFEKCRTLTLKKKDGTVVGVGDSFEYSISAERSDIDAMAGVVATVSYESENAVVSEKITFPSLGTSQTVLPVVLNCPYLMFEDFRDIESFNNKDEHSSANAGSKKPYYIQSGWGFARAGGAAGKAVRLAAHRELFVNYPSRCDSPVLNCIKEGKSVDLVFSFDYSMDRQEGAAIITNPKLGIKVFVGWTDKTGDLYSGDTDGTYADSFELNETGGSYDLIDKTYTVVLPNMTSQKRLSVREETQRSGNGNGTYWLYIDNIKVQIKK